MSDHDRTEALRRERKRFFWKLDGEILFSDAFKEIARDGQTVTAYLLILARQPIPPNKRDRTRMEKAGLWPPKDLSFSFPVREAPYHGLTVRGLARGLQRLHEVGIIDRIKSGSAKKHDFALYRLSERWRSFGKPTFEAVPWPKATTIGARGEGGKFLRTRGRKSPVVANPTTTKAPLMVNMTTTTPPVVVNSTMRACGKPPSVVVNSTMLLSSPSLGVDPGEVKKVKKKVRTPDPGSKSIAAPIRRDDATTSPKKWRPPLSEIKENVAEILRQRPDPRADDPQFVRLISGQLGEALAGRLDPTRVHSDFLGKHGFDDWTADLLFTIATINLVREGVTN